MAVIEFNSTTFLAAFPAFEYVPVPTLEMYWGFATDFIPNIPQCNTSLQVQTRYLNLMTAHICALAELTNKGENTGITTQASVDKISVTLQPPPEKTQWQWWLNQTPYGQQLLALLQVQSAGGWYVGGSPERLGFRGWGGRFG